MRATDLANVRSQVTVIESLGRPTENLGEIWRRRSILWILARRDLAVRYRQTAIGVGWALLQPTLATLIFTLFLGNLAGMPSNGAPYAVFSMAANIPWQLFAAGVANSANSLVGNANLLTKVYFPRVIIPGSSIIPSAIDLLVGLVPLAAVMCWFDVNPSLKLAAIPLISVIACAQALGLGLWLCALNARYRDVRFVVPFFLQLWMFLSPVTYPSSLVPTPWAYLYALNPMVGVIDGFRWAILPSLEFPGRAMVISLMVTVALLWSGYRYFIMTETELADII